MSARIYKPSRNAMQSGKGKTDHWVLEHEQETRRVADPLMGWTSTADTVTQVKLTFDTLEEAETYARRKGLAYVVQAPPPVRTQKKSYSDNFRFGRTENWTH
ncbi:MAG: ETC complex I subunit [Rhizobiales bacterium]|nr:ETC complex I subunit [Hyphomicrobiales bacterium]